MNNTPAPVFRKSMSGYNKEDVNAYIIMLSNRLREAEHGFEMLSAQNAELITRLEKLNYENAKIPEHLSAIEELTSRLESCTAELSAAQSANSELTERLQSAESQAEASAAEYDSICRSAGQIFALAGSTAEEILRRADNEAQKIVGEAHSAKKTVFKSISETTDGFTADLNNYIRSAINNCIEKINETARAYTPKAGSDTKPDVTFVDGD